MYHTHTQTHTHTRAAHAGAVSRSTRSSTSQAQTPPKTPCTNCARCRAPCLVANGVPGRGHGRLVHAKRARPEAPVGADDTSDHCRRPQLDRRESSARAAGRAWEVAGAGPRKARALTAAQPEASSAAPQQPRHRSREARSEAAGPHARRLCATARPSPRCAHCAAPSTRLTGSGKGWQALRRVAAEHHQSVSGRPSCAVTLAPAHRGGSMHRGGRSGRPARRRVGFFLP